MVEDHPLTLLKLPTEVRAAILKAALVLAGAYLTFDCGGRSFDKIRRKGEGNSGQILRTCKLLMHEGLPILYGQNHFIITFLQGRDSWSCLSRSLLRKVSPKNVALIRHLTITGDHELNDILAGNIPLPQNAKNMELAALFTLHPGLANLQSLCLEVPTFDAWHSLGDRDYQIWLNELPTSVVNEIKEAIREVDNNHFRSDKLDILSGRVSGCMAEWAALRAAATMSVHCPELKFFHIGGCRHGPLLIVTRNPMDVTESFEGLQDNSRTQVVRSSRSCEIPLQPRLTRCVLGICISYHIVYKAI